MRLETVHRTHRLKERLILGLVRMVSGDTPDIMRTLFHRPEFFGRPLGAAATRAMRGTSEWTVAERELFAAFLSQQNRCAYCITCHTEYACQAGERNVVERLMREGAGNDARLASAFDFLTAFAAGADAIMPAHLDGLRAAAVSEEAIHDLAQIAFCFSIINRVADALEFHVPPREVFARAWPAIRDRGYRV